MIDNATPIDPAKGLLHARHFQIAYATNDLDKAKALFTRRYGIARYTPLGGPLASGGEIAVALAWVGGVMIELLCATGPGTDIYRHGCPENEGFQLWHHHLGYLVESDGPWDALMAMAAREGHAIPHISHNAGFMKSCFIEAPELGHLLEYICPEPSGSAFFNAVERN